MINNLLLRDLLLDIYAPLRAIDQKTVDKFLYTIKPFGAFLGHDPRLSDLEELAVARFLAKRTRERAAATAAKDRANLRALWEFAARRRLIDTWPTIPRIKVPERVPEAWLTEDFDKLLRAAADEPGHVAGIPAGLWWRACLLLAYDTGERISAILALRWSQFRGTSVLFRAEDRKGKRRDILREISVQTADTMLAIRDGRDIDDLVLPWEQHYTYVWARLKRILKRAGLPHGRRDKFHRIRRTTASYYEAAGHSAQRLLDHSSPATTRGYLDPRIVKCVPAPDVLPKVGKKAV